MAPTVGSSSRRIRRRISRYAPADGTQVTGQQASKMWNYFFLGPLNGIITICLSGWLICFPALFSNSTPTSNYPLNVSFIIDAHPSATTAEISSTSSMVA